MTDYVTTRKTQLEKFRVSLATGISEHMMDAKVEQLLSSFRRDIVMQVSGFIWAEKRSLEVDTSYTEPLNWWQMLKRDWLPEWFVVRYPVKLRDFDRRIKVDFYKKYPEFRYEEDKYFGKVIPWMEYSNDGFWKNVNLGVDKSS